MVTKLKGGMGNDIVLVKERPTCKREKVEAEIKAIRAAREAQFELEAEQEAGAIRHHRSFQPRRERLYENR